MSVPAESMNAGIAAAVDQGVNQATGEELGDEVLKEQETVKKLWSEYSTARAFDRFARQRYSRDRRYASGTANPNWASDANIIGAYIDILVAFLYAKNPDVSVRPAARVAPPPQKALPAAPLPGAPAPMMGGAPAAPVDPMAALTPPGAPPAPAAEDPMAAIAPAADPMAALAPPGVPPAMPVAAPAAQQSSGIEDEDAKQFAETLQIVVSKQWKNANLKRVMKRVLRSSLSVGPGWFKAYMYSEEGRNPKLEKELKDARDNLERIQKAEEDLTGLSEDVDQDEAMEKLRLQIEAIQARKELMVKRGLCADYLRADDVQVSLDVSSLSDYRDADWISGDLYIEKDSAKARFPRLTDDDIKRATEYVQRETGKDALKPLDGWQTISDGMPEGVFVRATENAGQGSGSLVGKDKPVKFLKFVELWDHRDMHVKTMCDGVDRWAVEPFVPEYASSRFYPFFQLALFEVDGDRHPQSLSDRMWKLQDEYSQRRSSGRKTRERSIPGTVFNKGELDPDEAKRLEQSVELEMVGLQFTTTGIDVSKVIAAKPVPNIDPALFDTKDILYDMNVVSGVQEAQASGQSNADTATEADIQQSGFASRTNADRDTEEELLTELAQYTAELGVQCLTARDVQRLAGPFAFWPADMDVEDVLTLVEVEITAGTTGKPRAQADKETWATLLPLILDSIAQIRAAEAVGDTPMAETLKNVVRETLKRLDDRLTLESILVSGPAPLMAPGMPGAPPTSAPGGAGPPATGNGTVNNPVAQGAPAV